MQFNQHATPAEMTKLKRELNESMQRPGGNVIANFHELEEDGDDELNFVESNVFEEADVAPTQTEAQLEVL